jgi:hypothetical protein
MNWLKNFWKALNTPATRDATSPPAKIRPFSPMPAEDAPGNFTPRAQQVLALARREADRFHHNFVGTEHLLLGLVALGQGVAVNVLQRMGLDLETVRTEVEKQVGTGPDRKRIGNIPYTPRVKKVLAMAANEAKALHHTYTGTEHILLGLLREGDGVAGLVLSKFGVEAETTRQEILKELDPNFAADRDTTEPATTVASQIPSPARPEMRAVDLAKRYDVYCTERDTEVTVYRNVRFLGVKRLFQEDADTLANFYELEQANGQTVFVAKYSVIKFCAPGLAPGGERSPESLP